MCWQTTTGSNEKNLLQPRPHKSEEKESCFEYIADAEALQKSHVLKFQKRIW